MIQFEKFPKCGPFFQKVLSSLMHFWCPRVASSIISTMHPVAGPSSDGTRPELLPARTVACKWGVSPCSFPVAYLSSLALSLFAVLSISKVKYLIQNHFKLSLSLGAFVASAFASLCLDFNWKFGRRNLLGLIELFGLPKALERILGNHRKIHDWSALYYNRCLQ